MVDQINGASQAQPAQMTNAAAEQGGPKSKPDVKVFENQSMKDIELSGSEAQKILAGVFDSHKDGKYSKKEAEFFNQFTFTLNEDAQVLTAKNEKTGTTFQLKYANEEQLKTMGYVMMNYRDYPNGNITADAKTGTITIDGGGSDGVLKRSGSIRAGFHARNYGVALPNVNLSAEGRTAQDMELRNLTDNYNEMFTKYVIKNADLDNIYVTGNPESVTIQNTRNVGLIKDGKTQVKINPQSKRETRIIVDNDSQVDIIKDFKYSGMGNDTSYMATGAP